MLVNLINKCLKYHEDIDCQINFTQINNDEIIITQNYNIYLCKISNLKLHLKIVFRIWNI